MNAPRLFPLESPWSPVGYEVVEESAPAATSVASTPPEGYRVVQVADEQIAPRPRPRQRPPYRSILKKPASPHPALVLAPVIGGCFLLMMFFVGLMAMAPPASVYSEPEVVMWNNAPDGMDVAAGGVEIILPDQPGAMQVNVPVDVKIPDAPPQMPPEIAAAWDMPDFMELPPENEPAQNIGLFANEPVACDPAERFGTSVAFVRNPSEAARGAAAARKLTCILHVSGNFEDARFT